MKYQPPIPIEPRSERPVRGFDALSVVLFIAIGATAWLLLSGCPKSVPPAEAPVSLELPNPVQPEPSATPAPAATPKPRAETRQARLWETAELRPEWMGRIDKVLSRSQLNRSRYQAITDMRKGGVPWLVVAGLHERESSQSFSKHLHEGSPLTGRTRYVPKGRIPGVAPPYTFEQSAEDALYVLKHLDRTDWANVESALQTIEAYNGLGYQRFHPDVLSPYLWSGSKHYARGKYVADGKFSATAVDAQAGVAALLLAANLRGIDSFPKP